MQYTSLLWHKLPTKEQSIAHMHSTHSEHSTHRSCCDSQSSEALDAHLMCSRAPTRSIATACDGAPPAVVSSVCCGPLRTTREHCIDPLAPAAWQQRRNALGTQNPLYTSWSGYGWKGAEGTREPAAYAGSPAYSSCSAPWSKLPVSPSSGSRRLQSS